MDRREILQSLGVTTLLPTAALGRIPARTTDVAETLPRPPESEPEHSIRFAVCGMSHDHICGMVGAIQRGGGELEILSDGSIQLVLSSTIASHRAPLGVRVMEHGKDFLADKPGITTLEQLAAVRETIARTKRIYAIMYSERLEVRAAVKAGELIKSGAIGQVIQTINIAPHQVHQGTGTRAVGVAGPSGSGIPTCTAEFCATSARTRSISFCTTPAPPRPM